MSAIYLSPHHDDICFSLGGFVLGQPGGHLVNLYSRSDYMVRGLYAHRRIWRIARILGAHARLAGRVSRLRAREDQAFAARCQLTRHDLGLDDARLAGKPIWDPRDLEPEARSLAARLLEGLDAMPGERLFCPIGIGSHRDHVATLMAILRAYPRLSRRFRIAFYEDLHYASDAQVRTVGLERFRALAGGRAMRRHAFELSPARYAEKLALVALYASQHADPPAAGAYSPAGSGVAGPHEAVWEFVA